MKKDAFMKFPKLSWKPRQNNFLVFQFNKKINEKYIL